jgi:hypothetical protein
MRQLATTDLTAQQERHSQERHSQERHSQERHSQERHSQERPRPVRFKAAACSAVRAAR